MKDSLDPISIKFEKITLYETSQLYYLVGCDEQETIFRILKIDRRISHPKSLDAVLREDPLTYNKSDILDVLAMVNDGNRASGGLIKVVTGFGLIGFVKFLDCYYINLITQRRLVGSIGSNDIYGIKATEMFPIKPKDESDSNTFRKMWSKLNKKINQTSADIAESRYMGLFQFIDMSKDFFFSYTYDITRSLQHNYIMCKKRAYPPPPSQEIFEWNYYQTEELRTIVQTTEWILPTIHGSFQQRRFTWFGRILDMILIARRSRHYAGTRYLKRGISVHGKVANDCEVEQIMQVDIGPQMSYCSYVQMRGSIPTYWYQETSVTMPKPPILLNRRDPSYLASKEHFADLFHRYNAPIVVLDLVKQQERKPRESIVGKEFRDLIDELNNSIPLNDQIRYCALDYSRITKSNKHSNKAGAKDSKAVAGMAGVGQEWAMIESSLGAAGNAVNDSGVLIQDASTHSNSALAAASASGSATSSNKAKFVQPQTRIASNSIDSNSGIRDPRAEGVASPASHSQNNNNNTMSTALGGIGNAAMAAVGGGLAFAGGAVGAGVSAVVTSGNNTTNVQSPPPDIRVDVLQELENIATMTIADTGVFCTTSDYLDNVGMFETAHINKAKQRGWLEQRGVLRTNCIDCLDRTNVAQFAMGIRFLTVSLRALGVSESLYLDPTSPILMAMMDMFSEMGDRIALQYGGSEAHKKVSGSKASKNGELLTSIKRYYSNAFTDMVKQDAMNVFLGFYVPNERITPLWDLETDYFLHNKALRPPMPMENKILFNELKRKEYQGTGNGSAFRYRKGQSYLGDGVGHNDAEIVLKLLANAPDVDIHTVLRHYFFKSGMSETEITNNVIAAIKRSEKRKAVAKEMDDRVNEAIEMWWRASLQQFFDERQWMCLPIPEGVLQRKYFERVHKPNELTLFDSIFSGDGTIPITDATKSGELQYNSEAGNFDGEDNDSGNEEDNDNTEAAVVSSSPNKSQKNSGGGGGGGSGKGTTESSASAFTSFSNLFFSSKKSDPSNPSAISTKAISRAESNPNNNSSSSSNNNNVTSNNPSAASSGFGNSSNNTNEDISLADGDGTNADGSTMSGFFVRKYLRDKVRQVVGVFGAKKDEDGNPNGSSQSGKGEYNPKRAHMGNVYNNWGTQTLANINVNVSHKTTQLYTFYADCWNDNLKLNSPHLSSSASTSTREEDFKQSLRETSIDVDNVNAMEQLSSDSHVSRIVNHGMYKGMSQNESAIDANVFLFTTLLNVETDLRKCLDEEQFIHYTSNQQSSIPEAYANSSKESHMKAPVSLRASLTTQKSMSYDSSVRIPETTRMKLYDSCLKKKTGFGVESKLQALAARYLFQQVVYAREISMQRLASRLSALTTEKTILDYALTFEKESLVANIDMITFIATDGPTYQSFYELENLVEALAQQHERHLKRVNELIEENNKLQNKSVNESDSDNNTQNNSSSHVVSEFKMLTSEVLQAEKALISKVTNKEYPGFVCISPDQYEKMSNPFLHINEIAAVRFEELMQRLKATNSQ